MCKQKKGGAAGLFREIARLLLLAQAIMAQTILVVAAFIDFQTQHGPAEGGDPHLQTHLQRMPLRDRGQDRNRQLGHQSGAFEVAIVITIAALAPDRSRQRILILVTLDATTEVATSRAGNQQMGQISFSGPSQPFLWSALAVPPHAEGRLPGLQPRRIWGIVFQRWAYPY